MTSHHWFKQWLVAKQNKNITWANMDPDLHHLIASQCFDDLTLKQLGNYFQKIYISFSNIILYNYNI